MKSGVILYFDILLVESRPSNPEFQNNPANLTLSLPNATVVEFTIHCQTRLQSKLKGTVDSCLFLTVIRDANISSFISKCSGDIIVSYKEVDTIFCTRMEITKRFVMSLESKTCHWE